MSRYDGLLRSSVIQLSLLFAIVVIIIATGVMIPLTPMVRHQSMTASGFHPSLQRGAVGREMTAAYQ